MSCYQGKGRLQASLGGYDLWVSPHREERWWQAFTQLEELLWRCRCATCRQWIAFAGSGWLNLRGTDVQGGRGLQQVCGNQPSGGGGPHSVGHLMPSVLRRAWEQRRTFWFDGLFIVTNHSRLNCLIPGVLAL